MGAISIGCAFFVFSSDFFQKQGDYSSDFFQKWADYSSDFFQKYC